MTDRRRLVALLIMAFASSGCGEKMPMLTLDVLASATKRCGAGEFTFSKSGDASVPPSFSYLDPGPVVSGKPTPVSACLAEALKGYRFQSMEIRFEPGATAVP